MDESFSPESLRGIWDMEARRGRDRLDLYPDLRSAYDIARDARQSARAARKASLAYIGPPELAPDVVARNTRRSADQLLEASIAATSEQLIDDIETDAFHWNLTPGLIVGGKRQLYSVANTPAAFFADKHLQRVLGTILRNRPRGRQAIVAGLIKSLDNHVPKIVARVDVTNFYETVDHNRLAALLDRTTLTPSCRRLIDKLLAEIKALTGVAVGLPAGVGLSAKLAELYIAQADRALRDSTGTLYFARYVDDIILVRGQENVGAVPSSRVVAEIDTELSNLGLALNPKKVFHQELGLNSPGQLEFLGYELDYQGKPGLSVRLTKQRQQQIKSRIDRTFGAWDHANPKNHGRRSLLVDRLRLITGNTRLSHNKRNALVGIYFSNPHLTDMQSLRTLDAYLRARAARSTIPPELGAKIASLSFESGFINRSVYRWSMHRLKKLKGAWLA